MTLMEWWRRLQHLARGDRAARELDEEMQLHIELRARRNRALGITAKDAARQARIRFGNRTLVREDARSVWAWRSIERLTQDLRYGLKQIGRRVTSTAAVVIVLGLGIGANTAMFTVLNAVLFKPAAVAEPGRLAWVVLHEMPSGRLRGLTSADFRAVERANGPFESVTSYYPVDLSLSGSTPERIRGLLVSANYFDMLGVRPAAGRAFRADEDRRGPPPVVILSDGLWRRRFGADPAIVDQPVILNGRPFIVIGIAPRGFGGIELVEDEPISAWVPMGAIAFALPTMANIDTDDGVRWLRVVGRLARGIEVAQADAAVRTLEVPSRALTEPPNRVSIMTTLVRGGLDPANRRDLAPILSLLSVVPVLVLLVASANAANLMLAQGVERRREMAVRRSLGASRGRVVRQLLTESLMLAALGGVTGVALAHGLISLIGAIGGVPAVVLSVLRLDTSVLIATAAVSLATGVIFGTAPALTTSNPDLTSSLKDEGNSATASPQRRRLRAALVVGQVAVSLALLVASGLIVATLSRTLFSDPGFDTRHGLKFSVDLNLQGYTADAQAVFVRTLLQRVAAIPGVDDVAVTDTVPLGGRFWGTNVEPDGPRRDERRSFAFGARVSPRYFDVIGTPIVRGRAFDDRDSASATNVAIVNERLAKRLWPDGEAVGQRVQLEEEQTWRTVVGVVRTSRFQALDDTDDAVLYLPAARLLVTPMFVIARTGVDPRAAIAPIVAVMREMDPNLPVVGARPLADLPLLSLDAQRASASLLLVFGGLAVVLAIVGIYGVASHTSRLRTREVGIRMALGARPHDVRRLFIWEGLRLTLTGIAAGLLLSLVGTRLMASFLVGLGAIDAFVFAGAAFLLGTTAALASYLPASQAARMDPLRALRMD